MSDDKRYAELENRLVRLEAFLHRFPLPYDPSPDDWGRGPGGWAGGGRVPIPFPLPYDPSPIDISRFTKAQLELSLENVKAQRIRLDALEGLIKEQIKQIR